MNELQDRKRKLRSLEDRFKNIIESDSDEVENNLKTYVKAGAIVGVSFLVAYKVYRLLSPKNKSEKRKSVIKHKGALSSGLTFIAKQRLFAVASTLLYEEFKKYLEKGQKRAEESISEENTN